MIVTVASDEAFRLRVAEAVRGTPWESAVTSVGTVDECEDVLTTSPPGVVLVGPETGLAGAVRIARAAARLRTPPPVLLVAPPTTEVLRQAMRAGVRDVLPPAFENADLLAAFEDAGVLTNAPAARPGLTVAVFSAKGGVGTSVVASNLAVRLAELADVPTTLVDLDLASADQAIMHGLAPRWTAQDVADGRVGLDVASLQQVLVPIPESGARLFPGPVDPALAEMVTARDVTAIIASVRVEAPIAVLDTASSFDDRTLAALDAADVVVVVASLDVSSLRALTVSLQTLQRLEVDPGAIVVTLVRADSKSGLTIADIERAIDRDVDVGVPSTRSVPRSVNEGTPLAVSARRSGVVSAIDELAERVLRHADADFEFTIRSESSTGVLGGLLPWGRSERVASAERSEESEAPTASSPTGTTRGRDESLSEDDGPSADVVALPRRDGVADAREVVEADHVGGAEKDSSALGSLPPPAVPKDDDGEAPRRRRRR